MGAKQRAEGRGLVALNVMRAVAEYAPQVRRALGVRHRGGGGRGGPTAGACLISRPNTRDVALIPILSDARGVQLIVRKWERKQRLPDAIVIEHPRLGWRPSWCAAKVADVQ